MVIKNPASDPENGEMPEESKKYTHKFAPE